MGWFSLFLIVVLGSVVWFAYRELRQMEVEIRQKIAAGESAPSGDVTTERESAPASKPPPQAIAGDMLRIRLWKLVADQPGLLQTEVYPLCDAYTRKQLQLALLEMDRGGLIKRKKYRGSYRLFPR